MLKLENWKQGIHSVNDFCGVWKSGVCLEWKSRINCKRAKKELIKSLHCIKFTSFRQSTLCNRQSTVSCRCQFSSSLSQESVMSMCAVNVHSNSSQSRGDDDVNNVDDSSHGSSEPPDGDALIHGMTTTTTTTDSIQYKWAAGVAEIIHSTLTFLTTIILAILQFLLKTNPVQFTRETWNSIKSTMTIEIVSTVKEEHFDTTTMESGFCSMGLPILRLNSVTMEEYLRDASAGAEDSGLGHDGCSSSASDFLPSSNYNSSDCETDSGLHVFTGDEEAEADNNDDDEFVPQKNVSNLPQDVHPAAFPRRDSDTSDDGASDEQKSEEVTRKLITQVEAMFSDEHLAKDGFLLKHVRRRSDGFVSLKLVAGLRKVKQISREFPTVLAALRLSLKLDVNLDGTKVRRMEPLTPYLKALPISGGNKEANPAASKSPRPSMELTQDELLNRVNMKNYANNQNGLHKRIQRNNSNVSTASSNGSSRHGSFSKQYNAGTSPADLFYRNVHALSSDDTPAVNRRRGGSLPIPMNGINGAQVVVGGPSPTYYQYQRNSMYLSPNSSPPSGTEIPQRPKSNSYCEGTVNKNSPSNGNGGMSVWLQRRMASAASSTRSSEGSVTPLTGVVRQPRGPDGTKGFANGFRQIIESY